MRTFLRTLVLTAGLMLVAARAWPQSGVYAITDQTTYNAGSELRLKFVVAPVGSAPDFSPIPGARDVVATIRYAGETHPVVDGLPLPISLFPLRPEYSPGYGQLWKVPLDARTGRYEIDIVGRDSKSQRVVFTLPRVASFTVHRKLVRIERIELDRTFYAAGDPVACRATLKNLADRPLRDLRVEFSERYWPWIAQSSERAGVDVVALAEALSLPPGAERELRSARAAVTKTVKQPTVQQYAVVVWDQERKNIYDIAFSSLTFVHPSGVDSPTPYPSQYLYSNLGAVNVSSYRHFYPSSLDSPAIEFDRAHTMFRTGSAGEVSFSVRNPSSKPWRGASIRSRLLRPDGSELASNLVAGPAGLDPDGSPLKKKLQFNFPSKLGGVYRAEVEVGDSSGQILAVNGLELGVNPLPRSILIFCAHEDDEMAHAGMIRAAVENQVPIHIVYFTSGDAGSCDRYYQHSCGTAEALNFGALRMEEARAALGHLGVPGENISFLGLPDGGSGEIWYKHIQASDPYLAVLLASDHAPYKGVARPNLAYTRNSVVEMAEALIKKFQPEVIYTGHPDERHVDHRTNNWFVVKALEHLLRQGALSRTPTLLVDQVYGPGPQTHAPYRYQKQILHVSGETMALAQEAEWFYQSQDGNRAEGNLRTLDRLPRTEVHWEVLDWKDHEGWNERY